MSFILDALRKSEHERQRSSLPGLSHVPLATPPAQLPRWVLVVIGVLGAAVLALGAAWWQSSRAPARAVPAPAMVERSVELPAAPPAATERFTPAAPAPSPSAPARQERLSPPQQTALAAAATTSPDFEPSTAAPPVADGPALPSAASLAAEGVVLPSLRLELHAFSEQPRDRFVFINGRKYLEGERLAEGPQVVSIEVRGAVLAHAGRRFLLVPE